MTRRSCRVALGATFTAACLWTSACGRSAPEATPTAEASAALGPADECSALLAVIGKGVEELQKIQQGDPTPEHLRLIAGVMESTATETGKLHLRRPELADLAARYQAMGNDVATATRSMAAAAASRDLQKMNDAAEEMERAAKREDPIVAEVNALCGAR